MSRRTALLAAGIAALTLVQLVVGATSGLQQYDGKGFGYRLLVYPLMMALPPALWWWSGRGRDRPATPWGAFALVWAPFLTDVTGNTLDLFDAVPWWDDATHLVNWALLCAGLGLLLVPRLEPRWLRVLVVTGLGALLAIAWELGEWWTFIRRGVELDTAYEDTLADQALGTLGAFAAALWLTRRGSRSADTPTRSPRDVGAGS